jgi:hypothetical protein
MVGEEGGNHWWVVDPQAFVQALEITRVSLALESVKDNISSLFYFTNY